MENRFDTGIVSLEMIRPPGMMVRIDDQTYETVPPSWWGAEESFRSRQHMKFIDRYQKLMQLDSKEEPTQETIDQYKYHLREFAKIILPSCPQETINELHDTQLGILVNEFLDRLGNLRKRPSSNGAKTLGETSTSGT